MGQVGGHVGVGWGQVEGSGRGQVGLRQGSGRGCVQGSGQGSGLRSDRRHIGVKYGSHGIRFRGQV